MSKILICGDSFAADWSKKYNSIGWVNMIENDHIITNIAEAGVSEYKIYKQRTCFINSFVWNRTSNITFFI
jgi:hypothetical protein